jgi:hypothetical protein
MTSSFGVLEYWSIGVLEKAKTLISNRIIITPLLRHSITPADFRIKEALKIPSDNQLVISFFQDTVSAQRLKVPPRSTKVHRREGGSPC